MAARARLPFRAPLCVLASLAVLAPSCGGAPTRAGSAEIRTVKIDGRTNRFNGSFFAYFPKRVTVRPGDRVVFEPVWSGEPHTVTLGRLADQFATTGAGLPTAHMGKDAFPPAVVQPCYLETGTPPTDGISSCPGVGRGKVYRLGTPFNGRQTVYGTGFLSEGTRFTVPIASDATPGVYRYVCSFHGPAMSGEVEVVPPGSRIDSQGEVDARAARELDALVRKGITAINKAYVPFKRARAGSFPFPASAGVRVAGQPVAINEFVPFTIKAKRRERITWTVTGGHSISFKAPRNAGPPAIEELQQGDVQPVTESLLNASSSDPPAGIVTAPTLINGRSYSKQGVKVSGYLAAQEPGLLTYQIELTKAGTYKYKCLVHPMMGGLITVAL
jgi:plastocyanin